jgi:cyclopropane fatty-acyl-phospholipid synthase-like methyltransferase
VRYTRLSEEQKQTLLENTLLNIEQEHYATTLALQRARVSENNQQIAQFEEQLAKLEKQHKDLSSA